MMFLTANPNSMHANAKARERSIGDVLWANGS